MPVLEQLQKDQLTARKEKDTERLSILQMVVSAVKLEAINKRSELTDEEAQTVIATMAKRLKDSIVDFEKANRVDLLEQTQKEIGVLESYLPTQLSDEELEAIAKETLQELGDGPKDMGKLMGALMPKIKGKADGTRARSVIQRLLS